MTAIRTIVLTTSGKQITTVTSSAGPAGPTTVVRYDVVQSLSIAEKIRALANISADIGTTAPVNGAAATRTTGAGDAGVTWTAATAGTDGNDITVETTDTIPVVLDRATTLVSESGDAITVTRAPKARMRYVDGGDDSGVLVWTGVAPSITTGVVYSSNGATVPPGSGTWWSVVKATGVWRAFKYVDGEATINVGATSAGDFPDDASWASATLTAFSSSAAQVVDAASALTIATATLTSTGAATYAAVDPAASLTGGVGGTPAPPYLRVADEVLYVIAGGVWGGIPINGEVAAHVREFLDSGSTQAARLAIEAVKVVRLTTAEYSVLTAEEQADESILYLLTD